MVNKHSSEKIIKEIIGRSGFIDWSALELQECLIKDRRKVLDDLLLALSEASYYISCNKHWIEE